MLSRRQLHFMYLIRVCYEVVRVWLSVKCMYNIPYLILHILLHIKSLFALFIPNEIRYHLYRHRILPWPCFILAENESVSNFIILCIKPPPNNPYMLLVCMYTSSSNFQHHFSSILRFRKREYVTYLILYRCCELKTKMLQRWKVYLIDDTKRCNNIVQ